LKDHWLDRQFGNVHCSEFHQEKKGLTMRKFGEKWFLVKFHFHYFTVGQKNVWTTTTNKQTIVCLQIVFSSVFQPNGVEINCCHLKETEKQGSNKSRKFVGSLKIFKSTQMVPSMGRVEQNYKSFSKKIHITFDVWFIYFHFNNWTFWSELTGNTWLNSNSLFSNLWIFAILINSYCDAVKTITVSRW